MLPVKKKLTVTLLLLLPCFTWSFDWQKFEKSVQKEDYAASRKLVEGKGGERTEQQLAEAVLTIFEGRKSQSTMVMNQQNGPATLGGSAAYVGSKIQFSKEKYNAGMRKLNRFIDAHPDRLDARIAQLHMQLLADDFAAYLASVQAAFDRDTRNGRSWRLQQDRKENSGKVAILENVQTTVNTLFNRDEKPARHAIKSVGESMTKFFPKHVYGYNNIAVYHLLQEEFASAVTVLETAAKIDPADEKVTRNLGYAYERSGKRDSARSIYQALMQSGSPDAKSWAQQRLDQLK
jgi:tetratricopeptide (TPR) repeat protein